jgi:hypothetical protein
VVVYLKDTRCVYIITKAIQITIATQKRYIEITKSMSSAPNNKNLQSNVTAYDNKNQRGTKKKQKKTKKHRRKPTNQQSANLLFKLEFGGWNVHATCGQLANWTKNFFSTVPENVPKKRGVQLVCFDSHVFSNNKEESWK